MYSMFYSINIYLFKSINTVYISTIRANTIALYYIIPGRSIRTAEILLQSFTHIARSIIY